MLQPDFRNPSSPRSQGLRSFSDGDEHHFKGNPNYVFKDSRYHLAHPKPEKLRAHIADAVQTGNLKVYGWQRQSWDGSNWGSLDERESELFSRLTGAANGDEWVRRLTAGLPFEGIRAEFRLTEHDETFSSDQLYNMRAEHGDGWDDVEDDGQYFYRTRMVDPAEDWEPEDEEDEPPEAYQETEYYHPRLGRWDSEPPEGADAFYNPVATVSLKHPELGKMTRTVYEDPDGSGRIAYQAYWEAGKLGSGLSQFIYQSQMEAYGAAGVDKVKVHANISVGGYAWARHGFDLDDLDEEQYDYIDSYRDRVREQLQRARDEADQDSTDPHDMLGSYPLDIDQALRDGLHGEMSDEDFLAHATSKDWHPDVAAALMEHIRAGNRSAEDVMHHVLGQVGKKPEDFTTGHQLVQHLLDAREIGASPEEWDKYDRTIMARNQGTRHLRELENGYNNELDWYLRELKHSGMDPGEAQRVMALASQPEPPKPGKSRFEHSEIASAYDGWKDLTGWEPGESEATQHLDEVEAQIDDADTMFELSGIKLPPELADSLGVDPNIAQRALLGQSWHGVQDIYRSGGNGDGNSYRASKLVNMVHDSSVSTGEVRGVLSASAPTEPGGSAVNAGEATSDPQATRASRPPAAPVTGETAPASAWASVLGSGYRPLDFQSAHEVLGVARAQARNMGVSVDDEGMQRVLDHFRNSLGTTASPESVRHSVKWDKHMDSAAPTDFANAAQVMSHANLDPQAVPDPSTMNALLDHWDLYTRRTGKNEELPGVATATYERELTANLLGDPSVRREDLPSHLDGFLDLIHQRHTQRSGDPLRGSELHSALRYWQGGTHPSAANRRDQYPLTGTVAAALPQLLPVHLGQTPSDTAAFEQHLDTRGRAYPHYGIEEAHRIAHRVMRGSPEVAARPPLQVHEARELFKDISTRLGQSVESVLSLPPAHQVELLQAVGLTRGRALRAMTLMARSADPSS